jgi:hypothetical protein
MNLPGGLWQDGRVQREFGFRPMSGAVELALAEATLEAASMPECVTRALTAALQHLHDREATPALIDALSVGDRQFLVQQLAGLLEMDTVWMTAACARCGEQFDFAVRFSELPVKEAGEGYPFVQVSTSRGNARWRVPTGADQKAVAAVSAELDAVRLLVARCLVEISGPDAGPTAEWVADLSSEDVREVEAAIEAVAPEVTTAVQAVCIACGQVNQVAVDPYLCLQRSQVGISVDIHTIASTYHWSEAEILALPKRRRQRYLQLIDRARGMSG